MESTAAASQGIDRSAEIDGFSIRVYFWSRNPLVLAGIAAVILGIGLAIGRWLEASPTEKTAATIQTLRAELQQPQPDSAKVFEQLCGSSGDMELLLMESSSGVQDWIKKSKLSDADKSVAVAFCDSRTTYGDEPSADLLWYAHQLRPLAHANELVGDLLVSAKNLDDAIVYYEREAASPTADSARAKLIDLYLEKKNFAAADRLLATPLYQKLRTPERAITLATAGHRWGELIHPILVLEEHLFQPAPMLLAAVAGLVWIVVSLQAIQPPRLVCFRTLVPLLATIMGMASTFPTLLASEWQGEMWGLTAGKGVIGDVLFFVAGVGVREELMKLLFFVPFIPVLLVRKSRLEMLMIAGFVGLGFAIEENLQYFKQYGALAAFVRFLTANFFHLALTGTIGFSLCEAIMTPRRWWIFPVTFAVMVLAHGFYDVLAGAGGLSIFRLIVNLIFVLVSLFFFRQLRPLRDPATDQLNIAATLVAGLAILLSYIFVCAAREAGFTTAIALLLVEFIGLCMVCYMFYWQLGEGLTGRKGRNSTLILRMNGVLALLAIAGLIVALIGRWMVGAEARNISLWWLWALRLLPLAEIMFLARYWEVAKTGAITSLVGVALILPWGAKTAWDIQHLPPEKKTRLLAVLDGDQKNAIFTAVKREQDMKIEREQDRLQKLNVRMAGWFQAMQARRENLQTAEEIAAFNDEAAAYKSLHAVTREHTARLAELRATQIDSWAQVTEEMAREHLFGAKALRSRRD